MTKQIFVIIGSGDILKLHFRRRKSSMEKKKKYQYITISPEENSSTKCLKNEKIEILILVPERLKNIIHTHHCKFLPFSQDFRTNLLQGCALSDVQVHYLWSLKISYSTFFCIWSLPITCSRTSSISSTQNSCKTWWHWIIQCPG